MERHHLPPIREISEEVEKLSLYQVEVKSCERRTAYFVSINLLVLFYPLPHGQSFREKRVCFLVCYWKDLILLLSFCVEGLQTEARFKQRLDDENIYSIGRGTGNHCERNAESICLPELSMPSLGQRLSRVVDVHRISPMGTRSPQCGL